MGLDVTCVNACAEQQSNATCEVFAGCRWLPTKAECVSAEDASGKSTLWIGVVLSLVAAIIINVGMNAMKHAHNVNTSEDGTPLKSFLRVPWWWLGVVGIVGGEVGNVVAYGYAPAAIVTPMGAVGVLTNVIITTYVLKEPFSKWNILGVGGVVAGIVMVIYYAPRATVELHAPTLAKDLLFTPQFLAYGIIFVVLLAVLLPLGKRYGERSVFVYIGICAVYGSLTIVASKTFSTIVAETAARGDAEHFKHPAPYVSLILMVGTAMVSFGYVNSAMMHFGNSVVVPTYYAMFTICSVAAVALVYREFECLTQVGPGLGFLFGILLTVTGVVLLQSGKTDVVMLEDKDAEVASEHGYRPMSPIQEEDSSQRPSCERICSSAHAKTDIDFETSLVPQQAANRAEEAKARGFRRLPVHEVSVYKVSPGSDGTNSSSPDTPPTTAPHIFGAKSPSKFVSEPHPDEYRPNVVFYPHRSHSSSPTNSDGVDAAAKPKSTQERRGARSLTIRCA